MLDKNTFLELYNTVTDDFKNTLYELEEKDSHYGKRFNTLFENKLNKYVNYLNFQEIHRLLHTKKDLTLLDLGCGIGEKTVLLKKLYPSFKITGVETVVHDDPDHVKNRPQDFYERVYNKVNAKHDVNLTLFDGINIDIEDESLDIILLYAVIEHISPENRKDFIQSITPKLKPSGHIIITRCPQHWGAMEFISRKFNLGAHEWVLKREELLGLFEEMYVIEKLHKMNNIPNSSMIPERFYKPLVYLDQMLQFVKWPFFTDYFLIASKKDVGQKNTIN